MYYIANSYNGSDLFNFSYLEIVISIITNKLFIYFYNTITNCIIKNI